MSNSLTDLVALASAQPAPLALQDNPAHAAWQQQCSALDNAVQAAQLTLEQALADRDGLQAQVAEMEDKAPEPTIDRYGRPVTNPAYTAWKKAYDVLIVKRDEAQGRAKAAQGEFDDARAARASLGALEPPHQVLSTNPARLAWAQRIGALRAQLSATRWDHVFDGDGPNPAKWRAALAGREVPDQDLVDALVELVARRGEAERVWQVFEDQARAAEDESWRLEARVAELDRVIAEADADASALAERWRQYQDALQAVGIKPDSPPQIPGADL